MIGRKLFGRRRVLVYRPLCLTNLSDPHVGKTYSMFGEGVGNSRGMIPRCMEEAFAQLERRAKVRNMSSAQLEAASFLPEPRVYLGSRGGESWNSCGLDFVDDAYIASGRRLGKLRCSRDVSSRHRLMVSPGFGEPLRKRTEARCQTRWIPLVPNTRPRGKSIRFCRLVSR